MPIFIQFLHTSVAVVSRKATIAMVLPQDRNGAPRLIGLSRMVTAELKQLSTQKRAQETTAALLGDVPIATITKDDHLFT